MKLIAQVKLLPTEEQAELLKTTLAQANAACNVISDLAWQQQTFGQFALHKICYEQIRQQFGLPAQMVVRCIAKVSDAYKLDKQTKRRFKPTGAIAFDDRILTWRTEKQLINIGTLEGRQKIPYVCGEKQKHLLESRQGESDLLYRKGNFFLLAVCNVEEPTPEQLDDVIGVDFGIKNLATTSDGQVFTGAEIEEVRQQHLNLRQSLQQKASEQKKQGSRPRKVHRRLKQLAKKQRRFQANTNHCISKKLIKEAQGTKRSLALEELKGITSRTTVRKSQRAAHKNWGFSQLRQFLTYKALVAGVQVFTVDPRNTSRTCSVCGYCDKANRKSQAEFLCLSCGHDSHADVNAARNIRFKVLVNVPIESLTQAQAASL